MELLLSVGTSFEICVVTENYLSSNVKTSVYLTFNGSFKKHSFVSKFSIPYESDKNFIITSSKIIPINDDMVNDSLRSEEMGTITVYIDGKLNGTRKLPSIKILKSANQSHNQLGIRIILTRPRFRMTFRARKNDENFDVESVQ